MGEQMIFLVYSETNERNIRDNLGLPEYSYYFILKGFIPTLAKIGTVKMITDPMAEVDDLYHQAKQDGKECYFISFSPPHKTPIGLQCPSICVFAWEFDRIPDETWDDEPRNNWRYVFKQLGRTIALSEYAAQAVRRTMGENFPVFAIPIPVWDMFADLRMQSTHELNLKSRNFSVKGNIVDSSCYEIAKAKISVKKTATERPQFKLWDGREINMSFAIGDEATANLLGFYTPEPWGTWANFREPGVVLFNKISGAFTLTLEAIGFRDNIGRDIQVRVGTETRSIVLTPGLKEYRLQFTVETPTNYIFFSGLHPMPVTNSPDIRFLALGLSKITISRDKSVESVTQPEPESFMVNVDGVVYTTVFNPVDNRKNWHQIVTAFIYAFQNREDATLILKVAHKLPTAFLSHLHALFQKTSGFKCRIIVLYDYLEQFEYEQLLKLTTFYVNASKCEGLCIPLMEFMSCGIPAIATLNTAMTEYVTEDANFIVRSSIEPAIWPQDPRQMIRSVYYRIDESSLVEAFRESYRVAKKDSDKYHAMGKRAQQQIKNFCSQDVVIDKLKDIFI